MYTNEENRGNVAQVINKTNGDIKHDATTPAQTNNYTSLTRLLLKCLQYNTHECVVRYKRHYDMKRANGDVNVVES